MQALITIYDIAKRTGYSPTTVSKVFNGYSDVRAQTRKEILEAAEVMGYLPNSHARTLTTKRSWTIGVLFMESSGVGIRHPFFGAVMESFKRQMESRGYDLMFISRDIGGKPSSYLEHCRFRGVDAVAVILSHDKDPQVQELLKSRLPCVIIDSDFSGGNTRTVYSDNEEGARQAVHYLHELGHTCIGHIAGGMNTFAGRGRQLGYESALRTLGLELRPEYIAEGGHYSIESGREAMLRLLQLPEPPTAVFAAGDHLALGAMTALQEQGIRIPEQMSLIGFDDIELSSYLSPRLTTVRQHADRIGMEAAVQLLALIDGESAPQTTALPVELIVRESCSPFRG